MLSLESLVSFRKKILEHISYIYLDTISITSKKIGGVGLTNMPSNVYL